MVLFPQSVGPQDLQAGGAFELVHRRKAGVWIKQRLAGLVIVAAFDRDLRAVRAFLTMLLDKCAEDRRFALGGRKLGALPSFEAESRLKPDRYFISRKPPLGGGA